MAIYTSMSDDKEFGTYFLQDILEWVKERFSPEEIYEDDTLKDYVSGNFDPEDVYDKDVLKEWAVESGLFD